MSVQQTKCELCGEPMPPGEEMFKYHGFSGPCPKSPMPVAEDESDEEAARPEGSGDSWAPPLRRPVPLATPKQQTPNLMEALKQSLRNAKLGEPTPPATPQPGTKACGHRGPCECAHYIDPTRRALSPPPDVERLQQRWDTRDAALRALVEQWKAQNLASDARGVDGEVAYGRDQQAKECAEALFRLLEHEP